LIENSQVKVLALPWSPPAWMKQNGSLNGGSLKSDAYGALGQYFAKFVQAYKAVGIPIWAVSVQNEPMHEAYDYPTMKMSEAEHAQAIVSVRAALGSGIKVVGYDHNWYV
jgi:glucosylceramidase